MELALELEMGRCSKKPEMYDRKNIGPRVHKHTIGRNTKSKSTDNKTMRNMLLETGQRHSLHRTKNSVTLCSTAV